MNASGSNFENVIDLTLLPIKDEPSSPSLSKFKKETQDSQPFEAEITVEPLAFDSEAISKASDLTSIKQALSFTPLIRDTLHLIQSGSDLNSIVKNTTLLAEKFKEALNLIEQLPGIDVSIEQQRSLLKETTQRYHRQRQRHLTYLQLPIFNQISKRPRSLSPILDEPLKKKLKE